MTCDRCPLSLSCFAGHYRDHPSHSAGCISCDRVTFLVPGSTTSFTVFACPNTNGAAFFGGRSDHCCYCDPFRWQSELFIDDLDSGCVVSVAGLRMLMRKQTRPFLEALTFTK